MSRVAPHPDLFTKPEPETLPPDPIGELRVLLTRLSALSAPPWPTPTAAMEDEYRALHLAREAGPEGTELTNAILRETERLLAMTD
ncbi:MAG: hypothetical protein M0002_04450 [Rhodospirillales bacterium]|nr:hypothetical protein [Rhodospirillales bacterium]